MEDALASEGLSENANHETEHGGATVEQLHPLKLFKMDLTGSSGLIPLIIDLNIETSHWNRDQLA
jgi:hypothetical protein